jgi:hypothetical protein
VSETKRDYQIGYGKPPRGRPFQKGQSGNPRGPRRKDLSALLIAALNEPVYVTIDGKRRKITKREAIVTQMVNKSAKADLRGTKMLFDMMKEVEQKAGAAAPEPAKLTASDRELVELFVARLRRQIAAEAAEAAAAAAEAARPVDRRPSRTAGLPSTTEEPSPLPKAAVIARTVRAQFLKRNDPSQPGRASRAPICHEQRRRAVAQAYMAIAPPSTWISEPVM